MWNKVTNVSEIRTKRLNQSLRIEERRNKLKLCDRICYGIFIFHKSMLTGIVFWLEVAAKVVMNDKLKNFEKFIENISSSVIVH